MRFFKALIKGLSLVTGRLIAYLGVLALVFVCGVMVRPFVEKHTPGEVQKELGLEFAKQEPMVIKFSGEHAEKNIVTIACFADRAEVFRFPDKWERMLRSNLEWVIMVNVDVEPTKKLNGEMSYTIAENKDKLDKPNHSIVSKPSITVLNFALPMSGNRIMQGKVIVRAKEFSVRILPVEEVIEKKEEPKEDSKKEDPKDKPKKKEEDNF